MRVIDQNANHLIGLIDDILDISKIESGKFNIEREKVDLVVLLNEVYSLINVKAEEKGINLSFFNTGEIPRFIYIDPKRFKQVLFNILGNAIKFTEKGFVKLDVSFKKDKKLLIIRVQDTGIGISPEQVKKLFKPFSQADSSVGRKFGGTGLGLLLARKLIESMNGNLQIVNSNIGLGTTLEMSIDLSKSDNIDLVNELSGSCNDESSHKLSQNRLDNTRILIVDDAKENARLFELYLTEAGAVVDSAHEGNEALSKSLENNYDIILLDIQMPEMDGYQVIRQLKKSSYTGPVIALTAHAMKEEKEKTKQAGFDDHVTKPVTPENLVNAIFNQLKDKQY